MAVRLEKNNTCTAVITDLISHREKLDFMKKSINNFSKGNSAANIYLLILEMIDKHKNNNN